MTSRPWRQEIELLQIYGIHKTFTVTTSDGNALDVVTISGVMQECNKVSLICELGAAYIAFDQDASSSNGMYLPQDEGYFDSEIWIGEKISVIRATSTNVRVRGIVWGR